MKKDSFVKDAIVLTAITLVSGLLLVGLCQKLFEIGEFVGVPEQLGSQQHLLHLLTVAIHVSCPLGIQW